MERSSTFNPAEERWVNVRSGCRTQASYPQRVAWQFLIWTGAFSSVPTRMKAKSPGTVANTHNWAFEPVNGHSAIQHAEELD